MSWLRIDDKLPRHPKIATLTDREFRVWIRLLCYCAEYRTRGKVTESALVEVPGLTNATVTRFVTNGLLDRDKKGALTVHDWKVYNPSDPTAADRMKRHRAEQARNRSGSSRARGPVPSPLHLESEGTGRDRSKETGAATPATPNGAASLIGTLAELVQREWSSYPDKAILELELQDRGLTQTQAAALIHAEETRQHAAT